MSEPINAENHQQNRGAMNTTHTPGPWYAGLTNICVTTGTTAISFGVAGKEMGCMNMEHDTAEADACLIATAPDLLAVLEEAKVHLDSYRRYSEEMCKIGRGHEPSSQYGPEYLAGMIEIVINRAKGTV